MRITPHQVQITKNTVDRIIGTANKVWLLSSRTNDNQRGGDMDLLIETDATIYNRAAVFCRLYGGLIMALGDRKLDILLKDAQTADATVFEKARHTCIML
jgi:hypothetical protein